MFDYYKIPEWIKSRQEANSIPPEETILGERHQLIQLHALCEYLLKAYPGIKVELIVSMAKNFTLLVEGVRVFSLTSLGAIINAKANTVTMFRRDPKHLPLSKLPYAKIEKKGIPYVLFLTRDAKQKVSTISIHGLNELRHRDVGTIASKKYMTENELLFLDIDKYVSDFLSMLKKEKGGV